MTATATEPDVGPDQEGSWEWLRPHPAILVALIVALCFLAGVVGWWIGRPEPPKYNDVDVGFLEDMTAHHQSAISMGFAELSTARDPEMGHFAREIVMAQSGEIPVMNGLLNDAGPSGRSEDIAMEWMGEPTTKNQMPGMPTADEVAALRAATGLVADDLFSELMINHHAGGVVMAEYAAEHGENADTRRLAATMARIQRGEIGEMNAKREALGLPRIEPDFSAGH